MGAKSLLSAEKHKRDKHLTESKLTDRRSHTALEALRLALEGDMGTITQLELIGDYQKPVAIKPDRLKTIKSDRLDNLAFDLGSQISTSTIRARVFEEQIEVYVFRSYPYQPDEPLRFPLGETAAAANAFTQLILDNCTAESIDKTMASLQAEAGEVAEQPISQDAFQRAQEEVLAELVEHHPTAARLLGKALAFAEAQKRFHEYQTGQYHNFDEVSTVSVPPFSLDDLAGTFDNLYEKASQSDTVEVGFQEQHAFGTAQAFLGSLQRAGLAPSMPSSDEEVMEFVQQYDLDEDDRFSPR